MRFYGSLKQLLLLLLLLLGKRKQQKAELDDRNRRKPVTIRYIKRRLAHTKHQCLAIDAADDDCNEETQAWLPAAIIIVGPRQKQNAIK